ncbi:MAG: TIGR00303 family protein [Methanobacteriaceae archaeon]|nr:TIGR00303 family protein [Methanobacteriaceae archaeon]
MTEEIKIYGKDRNLKEIAKKDSTIFACVISTTETSQIPNLTGAGMTTELTKYTPAVDVEAILTGKTLSLPEIAMTDADELAAPTPGLLTATMMSLLDVPFITINAGSEIKPQVPYIELNGIPGKDIRTGKAVENPETILKNAKETGKQLSKTTKHIMIGESTPAGTTTAQGVLTALGYNVEGKISGSMKTNPHQLKKEIVDSGLKNAGYKAGDLKEDPLKAVGILGDPTIIATAGLVLGSSVPVTLAGGTQMAAVCAVIKALEPDYNFDNIQIATTSYVVEDETSNLLEIVDQIGEITVYATNPQLEKSKTKGLQNYAKGSGKEGVGAGGSVLLSYYNGVTTEKFLDTIDEICSHLF